MSTLSVANITGQPTANLGIVNAISLGISGASVHTGAATFSNTVVVTGNATFSNTVAVTGNVVFSNTVTVAASGIVFSDATTQTTASKVSAPSAVGQIPFSTDGSTYTSTQKIVQGTSVSLSTNTIVDFTGIPSWVKRVSVMFYNVSINGTSRPTVRLGTAGGIVSTGYSGAQEGASASGPAFTNLSGGFDLIDSGSAVNGANFTGILTIDKLGTGNEWVANWTAGMINAAAMQWMGGCVSIGGALTTVRLTTQGGTVQFTGGTVNILYE